ncbi:MAG: site-2 protease family protein [Planctomycetes bacterium]|nr:site-2 protease family protein [Planctomycetota bacterium]
MDALRWIQVAVGIGLVIFVHELGHFIAARWCKVRVECFSLGFGPRLFGWRRGSTLYQIAAVPLGGYVKMAGEENAGGPIQPDDLRAKSVGQRFFIFSGGVLMNVVFGLVVFPIVLFYGVPFSAPLIGEAVPGGPAWHARLLPGTRVLAVNGEPVISFMFIGNEVALGDRNEVRLTVLDPGATTPREVRLTPHYLEEHGFLSIEIVPGVDPELVLTVDAEGPAAKAGLKAGDRLVRVVGGVDGVSPTRQLAFALDDGRPLELEVENEGVRRRVTVEPASKVVEGTRIFGITAPRNWVSDLRANQDLAELGIAKDDRIVSIGGRPILRAGDLETALLVAEPGAICVVARQGRQLELKLPTLDRARSLALADDLALDHDRESTELVLSSGSPAADAGLRDGDRLVRLDDVEVGTWNALYEITKDAAKRNVPLRFTVDRPAADGGREFKTLSIAPGAWSPPYWGFDLRDDNYVYRAPSLVAALKTGFDSSWQSLVDAWRTLTRIARGDVSSKNIGGIIMISQVSYSFSSEGLAKLFFFLCMLSLNLAFLNVLPIPVLDGGHLFFLLVERVKGSPVSERIQGYSQIVGLVLIVSLMIYVTYNDLMRWVFKT